MKNCIQYLNYKNEKNEIYPDLFYAVKKIENAPGFDVNKFYESLNKVIIKSSKTKSFQLIRMFPINKAYCLFGVIYYLLRDSIETNDLSEEFDYLINYINYEIDICMIFNYLRNK